MLCESGPGLGTQTAMVNSGPQFPFNGGCRQAEVEFAYSDDSLFQKEMLPLPKRIPQVSFPSHHPDFAETWSPGLAATSLKRRPGVRLVLVCAAVRLGQVVLHQQTPSTPKGQLSKGSLLTTHTLHRHQRRFCSLWSRRIKADRDPIVTHSSSLSVTGRRMW